jgi:hypothetical protein
MCAETRKEEFEFDVIRSDDIGNVKNKLSTKK